MARQWLKAFSLRSCGCAPVLVDPLWARINFFPLLQVSCAVSDGRSHREDVRVLALLFIRLKNLQRTVLRGCQSEVQEGFVCGRRNLDLNGSRKLPFL